MSLRSAGFWAAAGGGAWVLLGYPLALLLLPRRPWQERDEEPTVTILIPGYREREELPRKLEALRRLDYPRERIQVIVIIDGDAELARLVEEAADPDVTVLLQPERQGKAAALNRGLAEATGEIVVMTDANNLLEPGSLRAAARHFADPSVWAVAGRRGEEGSAYDRYEDVLRRLETRSGSVAALSGEFMTFRRDRVSPLPVGVVNDDLWLLCQIVRDGGRVVYERDAGSKEPAIEAASELGRRSRIGAGRAMLISEFRGLPPDFAWRLASHKFGRLALPFFLLGAYVGSLSLSRRPPYAALAGLQSVFYAAGLLSSRGLTPPGAPGRLARAAGQFLVGNTAIGMGVIRAARGRQGALWRPVR